MNFFQARHVLIKTAKEAIKKGGMEYEEVAVVMTAIQVAETTPLEAAPQSSREQPQDNIKETPVQKPPVPKAKTPKSS